MMKAKFSTLGQFHQAGHVQRFSNFALVYISACVLLSDGSKQLQQESHQFL
jgi:hypothetical protein